MIEGVQRGTDVVQNVLMIILEIDLVVSMLSALHVLRIVVRVGVAEVTAIRRLASALVAARVDAVAVTQDTYHVADHFVSSSVVDSATGLLAGRTAGSLADSVVDSTTGSLVRSAAAPGIILGIGPGAALLFTLGIDSLAGVFFL